jgi:hypothetical protein
MVMRFRLRGAASRGLLATVTAGVIAGVAACGSVAAGPGSHPAAAASGSPAPATAPLCANTAHLDRVVVTLHPGLPQTHARQLLPRGITVSDPARVQALAAALCRLPAMPQTPVNCPMDTGGGYRLAFAAGGRAYPPVTVETSGCRSVSGLGPVRLASGPVSATLHKELGGGGGATAVPTAS